MAGSGKRQTSPHGSPRGAAVPMGQHHASPDTVDAGGRMSSDANIQA
jgi:hypothetical protein